jgi:hypothetical protein
MYLKLETATKANQHNFSLHGVARRRCSQVHSCGSSCGVVVRVLHPLPELVNERSSHGNIPSADTDSS